MYHTNQASAPKYQSSLPNGLGEGLGNGNSLLINENGLGKPLGNSLNNSFNIPNDLGNKNGPQIHVKSHQAIPTLKNKGVENFPLTLSALKRNRDDPYLPRNFATLDPYRDQIPRKP